MVYIFERSKNGQARFPVCVSFSLPTMKRLAIAQGDVTRSRFVERVIIEYLDELGIED